CTDSSMDLVFAVDSSTSLLPGEFEKVKEFLKKLVGQLPVGAERVRVGLVRFSSDVDVIAYLDQSDNIQEIRNFISSMAYKEGGTNTYTAFKVIREDVLTVARGDREESPDVVVVITDGKPWRPATTRNEAQLLQQKGASVVAFGVGSEISPRDLQQMSSGLVHNITGFDDLQGAADIFREFLCVGSALLSETVNSTEGSKTVCDEAKLDLVFVLDSSNSVSNDSFKQAKSFIADIVKSLPVGKQAVRVGLVRFGNSADVIATLRDSTDVTRVTDAIDSMEHVKEGTNTVYPTGDRPNVRTVVVVITDGVSEDRRATKLQAEALREKQARLVWVYIGTNDRSLMREKTRKERQGDETFAVEDFSQLGDEVRRQVLDASCQEDETTPAAPQTTTTQPETPPPDTTTEQSKTTSAPQPTTTQPETPLPDMTTEQSKTSAPQPTTAQPETPLPDMTTEQSKTTSAAKEKKSAESSFVAPTTASTDAESTHGNKLRKTEISSSSGSTATEPTTTSFSSESIAVATDANQLHNQTIKPISDLDLSTVSVSPKKEGDSAQQDGSAEGSWQDDWLTITGIAVGITMLSAVATGSVILGIRRCKQKKQRAGHDL
ncbi:hypothetical protein BaRGS_00025124, partial [Batillaria attramentaria]